MTDTPTTTLAAIEARRQDRVRLIQRMIEPERRVIICMETGERLEVEDRWQNGWLKRAAGNGRRCRDRHWRWEGEPFAGTVYHTEHGQVLYGLRELGRACGSTPTAANAACRRNAAEGVRTHCANGILVWREKPK